MVNGGFVETLLNSAMNNVLICVHYILLFSENIIKTRAVKTSG